MRFLTLFFLALLPILFSSPEGKAQTCNGSLGDPVVNITFGAGAAAALPLPPGVTSYRYTSISCPDDGLYTMTSQMSPCFNNTWHNVPEDHTPNDISGNMMLINASYDPSDFYIQRVGGLCGGTTYEFAAWVVNVLRGNGNTIKPNLTFNIESTSGTILGTYNTGDIPETPSATWKQHGFFFTTLPGVEEVVIRLTNNAPGGIGNDLALDDITFRACGPTITAESQPFSGNNNLLCEGEIGTVQLDADISAGYISPSFQWQMNSLDGTGWKDIVGATQASYTLEIPIVNREGYRFRLAVAEGININSPNCRVVSDSLFTEVKAKPTADAGEDRVVMEGQSITLNGKVTGDNLTYFWSPGYYLDNPDILNPVSSPTEDVTYTLNVMSDDGCSSTAVDEVSIRVLKKLVVPNAFTPNADMVNDFWSIAALETYPDARIRVFNRYGQIVFQSVGYTQQWDGSFKGEPLPTGVYYYVIDLKTDSQPVKGSVTIIR
ncbi:gliding motility-associated C-terminal domain-containing protein [Flavihumibacter sp. R14]|nr:gliding motility-associated C-terminal domain-containing protein [Flavihumibacter soli]